MLIAIVGFVFVVLLPRVVDYDAVRAALAGLTAGQLAALVGATTVAYVLNAGPARVLVPGLTWRRAVEEDLVGRAVASTIPGPSDVAIKSVLFGQWKIPLDSANAGLFLASLFEPLSSLVLPLIATIGETPAAAAVSLCRGQSVRDSLALTLGRVDATQRLL